MAALMAVVFLVVPAYGAKLNQMQIGFVNEWGDPVNMGTSVSLYIYQAGTTTELTSYLDKAGANTVTQPVEDDSTNTPLDYASGVMTFWCRSADYKVYVTDGTYNRTLDNLTGSDTRIAWPTYLTAIADYELGQTNDLDFTYGQWVMDGDTAARVDMIPDSADGIFAFGASSGERQGDVFLYASSTEYIEFDQSSAEINYTHIDTIFDDDSTVYFGDGKDISVKFDNGGDDLDILGDGSELAIGATGAGLDVFIWGQTGNYIEFDEDNDVLKFVDVDVQIQDGSDLQFYHTDAVDWTIECASAETLDILSSEDTDDVTVNIGKDQEGVDLKVFGATTGSFVQWDASGDELMVDKASISLSEGDAILLGDPLGAGDAKISSTATVLTIGQVVADTGTLAIGADDHDMPTTWYSEATGAEILLSGVLATFDGVDIVMNDGDIIDFGDDIDFSMSTAGAGSGGLIITGKTTHDQEVVIGDGTIGTDFRIDNTTAAGADITWDDSAGTWSFGEDNVDIDVIFYGETSGYNMTWTGASDGLLFADSAKIFLGNTAASPDQSITPDGTNVDWDINSGILTIGDGGGTNYMSIAADGEINLVGTAKVTKNHQLPIATGGGTATVSALTGAPSIDFNASDEIVYASFQVPNDWDAASDMNIVMMVKNEIAETDGDDVSFTLTVKGIADGEAHTDTGQTVAILQDLTGNDEGQNYVNKCTGTIDYNEASHPIAAGDTVIIKVVVNLGTGAECTGPLHIVDWWIEYTASTLGTAT